jgi:N-acetylglutamate synthase-like GNAT family acetyltransferase/protein-tyrosine-phosphatase
MAAAFFNDLADRRRAAGVSAGTEPAAHVHPEVVATMREIGIDLSKASPRLLTPELGRGAAWLITMGCGDACPLVPGVKRDDWPLRDPKGQDPATVRAIRDEIRARVEAFARRGGYTGPDVSRAGRDSLPEFLAFLSGNGLPPAGLAEHATDLLVARDGNRLVGTAALEVYGPDALLRSVAVDPGQRGGGLGRRLTRAVLEAARSRGVRRVFLLTETASGFFPRFGFAEVERASAPPSIRGTVEFASACPASARMMVLELA